MDDYDKVNSSLIESLLQRQRLFERLSRIQRSISHHAPLQEVLDAITAGACELLGDEVVGLRLIDEDDPSHCIIVSSWGVKSALFDRLRRSKVGDGAGGLAIREKRLVVLERYASSEAALEPYVTDGLKAAMATPVHEGDRVVGSLVVASYREGRSYTDVEQEVLLAFAQHASLALSDARTIEAMREAQRSKEMFFAMVSHELKTPLAGIMGILQTLERHHSVLAREIQEEMIAASLERSRELATMINRLLAGARAELAAAKQETFLPDLMAEAIKGFKHSTKLKLGPIPQLLVRVDTQAVCEIIGILLENAMSHSPGDDEISIHATSDDDHVAVAVSNVGSLPDDIDHGSLFAAFQRGSSNSSGVGLGLYIAARLAQSIGGRIEVGSAGDTVEFKVRWPLETVEERDDEMSPR